MTSDEILATALGELHARQIGAEAYDPFLEEPFVGISVEVQPSFYDQTQRGWTLILSSFDGPMSYENPPNHVWACGTLPLDCDPGLVRLMTDATLRRFDDEMTKGKEST